MQFLDHISLKNYNTFGVKVKARYFVSISAYEEIEDVVKNFDPGENRHFILGGGSNLLFTRDFNGWILHSNIKGYDVVEETDDEVLIKAGSGENWSNFVDFTVQKGWGGLENLSLIPGTVGAAPVQNIGAYGVEQKDAFESLEACNLISGQHCYFNKLECDFDYRSSIFKGGEAGKWLILNVTYRLKKKPDLHLDYAPLQKYFEKTPPEKITVRAVSEAVKAIRRAKLPDPEKLGNAGSFFKNPIIREERFHHLQQRFPDIPFYRLPNGWIKIPAGWLIEQTGWKGKRKGDAGVYERQALVIVNYGKATGPEILNLAKAIQKDVLKKFDIQLEPEVLIL
jgi:UDP-N-acetylmuramate dehydrogenase